MDCFCTAHAAAAAAAAAAGSLIRDLIPHIEHQNQYDKAVWIFAQKYVSWATERYIFKQLQHIIRVHL